MQIVTFEFDGLVYSVAVPLDYPVAEELDWAQSERAMPFVVDGYAPVCVGAVEVERAFNPFQDNGVSDSDFI